METLNFNIAPFTIFFFDEYIFFDVNLNNGIFKCGFGGGTCIIKTHKKIFGLSYWWCDIENSGYDLFVDKPLGL